MRGPLKVWKRLKNKINTYTMSAIKNFIEKVSYLDGRGGSLDYRMSMNDARILRDEVAKLLNDFYDLTSKKDNKEDVIKIEVNGGKF